MAHHTKAHKLGKENDPKEEKEHNMFSQSTSTCMNDGQQVKRSELPCDAAIESCSPDAQRDDVDGQQQVKNPESLQDAVAESYSPNGQVAPLDDCWEDESLEWPSGC